MCTLRVFLAAFALGAAPVAGAQVTAAFASVPARLSSRPDTQIIVARRFAGNRDVSLHYDKSAGVTTVAVAPFNPGGGLDLRISASFAGRAPHKAPTSVRFVFASSAFEWIYRGRSGLKLALPDATILNFTSERLWKTGSESLHDQGIGPVAIEVMTFEIPWTDVQHLVQAGSAIGMLGPTVIELTPRRVAAIADLVNRAAPAQ